MPSRPTGKPTHYWQFSCGAGNPAPARLDIRLAKAVHAGTLRAQAKPVQLCTAIENG